MRFARFAMPVVLTVVAWSMFQGCSSGEGTTTTKGRTTSTSTGSGGATTGGGAGGGGGSGATGGGVGGTIGGGIDPTFDASRYDVATCVKDCKQYAPGPGGVMEQTGQYCGRIGDYCGKFLDCPPCENGFTCGGSGVKNLCGADRDAGNCPPTAA